MSEDSPAPDPLEMPENLKAALVRPPNPSNTDTDKPTFGPGEQSYATADKPYMTVRNGQEVATAEEPDIQGMEDHKGEAAGPVKGGYVKADIKIGKLPTADAEDKKGGK